MWRKRNIVSIVAGLSVLCVAALWAPQHQSALADDSDIGDLAVTFCGGGYITSFLSGISTSDSPSGLDTSANFAIVVDGVLGSSKGTMWVFDEQEWIAIGKGDKNYRFEQLYSTAMSAYLSGTAVRVFATESALCYKNANWMSIQMCIAGEEADCSNTWTQ